MSSKSTSSKSPAPKKSRKPIPFAAVRVDYAKAKDMDVTIASKRLRGKIRASKDPVIVKWLARHNKDNRDGNRYGAVTAAERKVLLSL